MLPVGEPGGGGENQIVKVPLHPRPQTDLVAGVAQLDVEHGDAAWLQQEHLRLFQRDDRPALLETVPRLVDADDAEGAAGDVERVAHPLVHALCRAPAQDERLSTHSPHLPQPLSLDDAEVGNGETLEVVAEDVEIGGILGLDVAHQHAVHAGYLRPGEQLAGDRLLHTAYRDVHLTGLGEHQVGLAAPGHSRIASARPLGHRPQRDDSRHADRDAQQCEDGAAFAAEEVCKDHDFAPQFVVF